jgi:hypothetical protein
MSKTVPFTIRLSIQAIAMIEEDLVPTGLYGTNRAEVCRSLITSRLEQLAGENIVRMRRGD